MSYFWTPSFSWFANSAASPLPLLAYPRQETLLSILRSHISWTHTWDKLPPRDENKTFYHRTTKRRISTDEVSGSIHSAQRMMSFEAPYRFCSKSWMWTQKLETFCLPFWFIYSSQRLWLDEQQSSTQATWGWVGWQPLRSYWFGSAASTGHL